MSSVIKTIVEETLSTKHTFSMNEEVYVLLMNVYEQSISIGVKPSFVDIIQSMPEEIKQQIKTERILHV